MWNLEKEIAFKTLKEKLLSASVLLKFNPDRDCELRHKIDASLQELEAALLQENNNQQLHPVAYINRNVTKNEKNLEITEWEC